MADMARRKEIPPGSQLNADDLHQLVEDSALVNVVAADTVSGTTLFRKTTPGGPVEGDTRVNGVTGYVENYDGADWDAVADEVIQVTLTNADTLTTCYTGSSVRIDYDNDSEVTPLIGTRGTNEAAGIGVAANVAGPGQGVDVIIRGPAWAITADPTSTDFESGAWLRHPQVNPSATAGVARLSENPDGVSVAGSTVYGRVMASVVPGATPTMYPAYITGKR